MCLSLVKAVLSVKHMQTVYILWLRQVKKYFRSRSRIIGSLGQPILYLLAFGYGFGSIYQRAGEGNYLNFLAPGVILMSVLFSSVFAGIEVIWDKQFGFLKETLVAPVSRFQIMLGRTLGGATTATFQGMVVFILAVIVGFRPSNYFLLPLAIVFIFLVGVLFTALGTAIASLLDDMQGFQLIINFLVMPIFFLSGALFPLENVPPAVRVIAMLDPLSYGVDGLRMVLIDVSHFPLSVDLGVIALFAVFFLSIGSFLFQKIQL